MKRLFIAIPVTPNDKLLEIIEKIKKTEKHVNWVNMHHMHLTLAFLGNTDESLIPDLKIMLNSICKKYIRFQLEHNGLGTFGSRNLPHVIWMGIKEHVPLLQLQKELASELMTLNFETEKREFRAHITIGRIKRIDNLPRFQSVLKIPAETHFGYTDVFKLILFESTLSPQGPVYKELYSSNLI